MPQPRGFFSGRTDRDGESNPILSRSVRRDVVRLVVEFSWNHVVAQVNTATSMARPLNITRHFEVRHRPRNPIGMQRQHGQVFQLPQMCLTAAS